MTTMELNNKLGSKISSTESLGDDLQPKVVRYSINMIIKLLPILNSYFNEPISFED